MWPRLGALIEKFRLDEDKLLGYVIDELLQQQSQQYDIIISGRQWRVDAPFESIKTNKIGFVDGAEHSFFKTEGRFSVDQSNPLSVSGYSQDTEVDIDADNVAFKLEYETLNKKSDNQYAQFIRLNNIKSSQTGWMPYNLDPSTPNQTDAEQLISNLLKKYNYWHYRLILPSAKIDNQDDRQLAVLVAKNAYRLSDCSPDLKQTDFIHHLQA